MCSCACMYDLQKAYDSMEYPVLLQRLFDIGISGKLWRINRILEVNPMSKRMGHCPVNTMWRGESSRVLYFLQCCFW